MSFERLRHFLSDFLVRDIEEALDILAIIRDDFPVEVKNVFRDGRTKRTRGGVSG